MKKLTKFPILVLASLLVACGPSSTPTTEPTTEPTPTTSNTEPTTVPTTDPTTEPSISNPTVSDPTTSVQDNKYEKAVNEKLGTYDLLKTFVLGLGDEVVNKINFTTSNLTSYSNTEDQIETMFRSHEIYSVTTSTNKKSSGDEVSKETIYKGIVDGLYYEANLSTVSNYSNVKRVKISDEKEVYETDVMSQEYVEEELASLKSSVNLGVLSGYGYWENVIDNDELVQTEYTVTIDASSSRVVLKGYQEGYQSTVYTLIANFDENIKLISGSLTTEKYAKSNWDSEKHEPISKTKISSKTKCTLDGVEYGEPLPTSKKTMIDLSKYFVESLNSNIVVTNFVTDPMSGMAVYSEPNTVFPNQPLDCPVDYIIENGLYAPSTALDVSNLYITGASKEGFLSLDGYGWVVSGEIGDKATIYIGNCFNDKLGEVEIEIVKSPIANNPMINPSIRVVEGEGYDYSDNGSLPTLEISDMNTIVMSIGTYNPGPFDSLPISFWVEKSGIAEFTLVENQKDYYSYGSNAIYFTVKPLKAGTTKFAIADAKTGEGYYEISLTVK
jgi:hypothetical protein